MIVFEGIYAFFYAFYHVISLKQISTSWIVDRDFKNEKYGISPKKNARKMQEKPKIPRHVNETKRP